MRFSNIILLPHDPPQSQGCGGSEKDARTGSDIKTLKDVFVYNRLASHHHPPHAGKHKKIIQDSVEHAIGGEGYDIQCWNDACVTDRSTTAMNRQRRHTYLISISQLKHHREHTPHSQRRTHNGRVT